MRGTAPLFVVFAFAAFSPAGAQSPSSEAPHGDRRVRSIRIEPEPLTVQMGDTIRFTGVTVDESGAEVADAVWGATDGTVFEIQPVEGDGADPAFELWGTDVGESPMMLFIAAPTQDGSPRWRRVGSVTVTVRDYPVAALALDPLPFAPYAGSSFALSGRVVNAVGREHAEARITWSATPPDVATVDLAGRLHVQAPGSFELVARADTVEATLAVQALPNPVTRLELPDPPSRIRTGDVSRLTATALASDGRRVADVAVTYQVESTDLAAAGAWIGPDGTFVAERPGRYGISATTGEATARVELEAFPRDVEQVTTFVAHVPTVRATDVWVFEGLDGRDYAYIGTLTAATMYAIDVTDPAAPVMTDSVTADGRRVNDVKINDDRTLAIITSENASNRRNGITLLDISDPAHPSVLSHYTDGLTGGVHNVWFVGDLVYAVNDGTLDVHVIDVSDPTAPTEVGRWGLDRPGRYLHDVSVIDGLAYLSYWNDGVVILDVGAGIRGGTPVQPVFVSSYKYRYEINGAQYGNTHHAIRYGDYLFLGDEIFGCPGCTGPRGYVHVVDVREIERPREVAFYRVPEAGSHNLWVEDGRLYVAYYQGGLRVVDVSGELRGDLRAQGREIASFETSGTGGTMSWGPQPFKGHVFVSDMNSGLWIVKLEPEQVVP
jgi:hypothetical protein